MVNVIDILDFRCNNITNSECKGIHINSAQCFSFGLSTLMNINILCIMISGYNAGYCFSVTDKFIEMSNFICESNYIFECYGSCPYKLTLEDCTLFNLYDYSNLAYTEYGLSLEVLNCYILNIYHETNQTKFINCTIVEYDESYITLYPHYTNGIECIGPENVEKNEKSCDSGDCVDRMCDRTIGFPNEAFPYTTFCHECTNTFSETKRFTESNKFSETERFTESIKFSASEKFTRSSSIECTFFDSSSNKNINENDKTITFSMTIMETIVNIRTVIFSNSFTLTVSHFLCNNENTNICETIIYKEYNFPYIIHSYTHSLIKTHLLQDIKIHKKKLSSEQLIGVVCGTVALLFAILTFAILIIQRKNKYKINERSLDDDTESDSSIKKQEFNICTPKNETQIDDWI